MEHPMNTAEGELFSEALMKEVLEIKPHVWRGVMRELAYVPVGRHAGT